VDRVLWYCGGDIDCAAHCGRDPVADRVGTVSVLGVDRAGVGTVGSGDIRGLVVEKKDRSGWGIGVTIAVATGLILARAMGWITWALEVVLLPLWIWLTVLLVLVAIVKIRKDL
jgi:hypothetical protein